MPPKYLTLTEKSKILEELDKGQSVTKLAKQYGVAKSTICSIRSKQKLILKAVSNTVLSSKRRTLKCAEFPEMEKLLYKWFLEQFDKQVPVNSPVLKEKAKRLHEELHENNNKFIASDGWLQRFKVRYGVRFLKSRSSRSEFVSPFRNELNAKIKQLQLSSDQIYYADETGLYWKLLPETTYISTPERITILACTNATGTHKVNPLVIGKARTPHSFTNLNCPVHYRNSKSGCMTEATFNEWFQELFIPEVKSYMEAHGLPVKALLILNNSPSRPPVDEVRSTDGCIIAIYMPPVIQSMDQSVTTITKLYYRKSLLSSLISKNYENVVEAMQQLSLKEAIFNLALAWDNLKPGTIRKCWHNILPKPAVVENEDDNLQQTLSEVVTLVNHISPGVKCFEIDINKWNEDRIPDDIQYNESNSDDDCITEEVKTENDAMVSSKEAVELCNQLLNWAEENDADYSDILVLRKLREKAVVINLTKNDNQQKLCIPLERVFVTVTEDMIKHE